ncbi:MAG: hypothetical protein V1834_00460 [Candidatus Micrarchaeota archaeon]
MAESILTKTWESYNDNLGLLSLFAIPAVISTFLIFLLPNYVSLSGVFLRWGSVFHQDLTLANSLLIAGVFIVALALFSFGVAAINVVVKQQRTLTRLSHYEMEEIEEATLTLFLVLLGAFVAVLLFNILLGDVEAPVLRNLFALVVSLIVLFAPQAIVIDRYGVGRAIKGSLRIMMTKTRSFVFFLFVASIVLMAFSWLFLYFPAGRIISLVFHAIILLPFFEVFKTQIYLSRYSLL